MAKPSLAFGPYVSKVSLDARVAFKGEIREVVGVVSAEVVAEDVADDGLGHSESKNIMISSYKFLKSNKNAKSSMFKVQNIILILRISERTRSKFNI